MDADCGIELFGKNFWWNRREFDFSILGISLVPLPLPKRRLCADRLLRSTEGVAGTDRLDRKISRTRNRSMYVCTSPYIT